MWAHFRQPADTLVPALTASESVETCLQAEPSDGMKDNVHSSYAEWGVVNLRLNLTSVKYDRIKPDLNSTIPHLHGNWQQLMYDKFYEVFPTCLVVFNYSHVRKPGLRKTTLSFWHGKAVCSNCISVQF